MEERGIQDTKIYFSNEGRFTLDMIKGMKGQKRWLRHFVDDYFERSGDTFVENFSKRLTDVSDRISFLIQSSKTESPKSSPRNWWKSI